VTVLFSVTVLLMARTESADTPGSDELYGMNGRKDLTYVKEFETAARRKNHEANNALAQIVLIGNRFHAPGDMPSEQRASKKKRPA
jgi:hypothetical protein